MTGAVIEIDRGDYLRIQQALDRLIQADARNLLTQMTGLVENQTRRRVQQDKVGPDGRPWDAWSTRYAATRGPGKSLLQGEGDLMDSLDSQVDDEAAEVGTNLVYGATHQFGDEDRNIPARPYLGLSRDDLNELERLTVNYGERLLAA